MNQIQLKETGCCPACREREARRLLYKLKKFDVFQCQCGVQFIDPSMDEKTMIEIYRTSANLQQVNPTLEHYYEYETLNPKSKTCKDYYLALEEAAKIVGGRDLLEVGCGQGSFLKAAKDQGWIVCGIDSGLENVQALAAKGIEGICSNYLEYSGDKKFDLIVFWDLLEHPQEPIKFIQKTHQLLKPGGAVLIASPLEPNFLTILASWLYRLSGGRIRGPLERFYVIEHTSYFSFYGITEFLKKNGFNTVKIWKTETDLNRYKMSGLLKLALKTAFFIGCLFGLQNRFIAISRKSE